MTATAYLNWGRWVADCPNETCSGAMEIELGQTDFLCGPGPGSCGTTDTIEWPTDPADIQTALAGQAEPQQSWRPGEEVPE